MKSIALVNDASNSFLEAFARQRRVMHALMLRNMRTRFFGNGLGYLIAIAWPIVHILLVMGIFALGGRGAPYGESAVLFVATGSVPFMIFSYMSRLMIWALLATKPLLSFPEVKVLDALFAGAILEMLTACVVATVMVFLAMTFDIPYWPADVVEAASAFGAAVLLGLGFGVFFGVIAMALPTSAMLYTLLVIGLWAMSGVYFVPSAMPEPVPTILGYIPTVQTIEWMRIAYYGGYPSTILDRGYCLGFGFAMLAVGLVMEYGMRGFVMALR